MNYYGHNFSLHMNFLKKYCLRVMIQDLWIHKEYLYPSEEKVREEDYLYQVSFDSVFINFTLLLSLIIENKNVKHVNAHNLMWVSSI